MVFQISLDAVDGIQPVHVPLIVLLHVQEPVPFPGIVFIHIENGPGPGIRDCPDLIVIKAQSLKGCF